MVGQSLGAGGAISLLASFEGPFFRVLALALAVVFLLIGLGLTTRYGWDLRAKQSGAGSMVEATAVIAPAGEIDGPTKRSASRRRGDMVSGVEIVVVAGLPLLVLALSFSSWFPHWPTQFWVTDISIIATTGSILLLIIFISSLFDWFYVRPRRDGLIYLPPCWVPRETRWHRLTKGWLIHRMIADIAFAILLPLTGIILIAQLGLESSVSSVLTRIVGLLFTLAGFSTRYAWRRIVAAGTLISDSGLPFRIGETISWRIPEESMPGNLALKRYGFRGRFVHFGFGRTKPIPSTSFRTGTGGFVFDVSTKETQVLHPSEKRTKGEARAERLLIRELMKPGAVPRRTSTVYCGIKALGGGCRTLHPDCERRN